MRQSMPIPMWSDPDLPTRSEPARCDVARSAKGRGLRTAILVGMLALVAGQASADTSPRKLGRGLANLTTGVIVLPAKVIETTRAQGPFVGATWGLMKGVGWVLATETIGLFEFLTCPFETPPDFKPILQPEYPWGHYQDVEQRKAKVEKKRRSVFTRDR